VMIEQTGVKENVEVIKDNNGKETGKKSTYVMQITYTYASQAKVVDYKGEVISTFTFATRDEKRVYNSESFATSAEANAYLRFGLIPITSQLIKQSTNEAVNSLNATLTLNYGYPQRVATDFFWILNSRKHPEYENHHRAWLNFKQAITNMSPDEPLDHVKANLQPVIDYFNSVKKKYNSNSKADKKLRYASYYNLAKIYWYLDDPDAAMREANELVINGFDPKDGDRLEAGASDLKDQLRRAKRVSRHFKLNVDDYQGIGYSSGH
jgi:tetratricopeptide (TPR) repeat protein